VSGEAGCWSTLACHATGVRLRLSAAAFVLLTVSLVVIVSGQPWLPDGVDSIGEFPGKTRFAAEPAQSIGWQILFSAVGVSLLVMFVCAVAEVRHRRSWGR
jgi:heme/copper-type cytochrome/quinol oxidase subunit 2